MMFRHPKPLKTPFVSQFCKSDHLLKGVLYCVTNAGEGIVEHRKNKRSVARIIWNIHKRSRLYRIDDVWQHTLGIATQGRFEKRLI